MAMAISCSSLKVMVVVTMAVFPEVSMGAVYKVGDSAGWTTIGSIDYKKWAATKTFHLGDVIHFEYNAQFHNVMRVKHGDYRACNTSSPMASYATGNDSITITSRGHHYFLCGVPGHCQAGQKLDINVARPPTTSVTSMAPTPALVARPPTTSVTSIAPTPALMPLPAPPTAPVAKVPGTLSGSHVPFASLAALLANLLVAVFVLSSA